MRSPCSIKEIQQLTGRLVTLSRFLSCVGDKAFAFFASIKKKEKFEWTSACEEAFTKVKEFLSSPPVRHRPSSGAALSLYLSVSDNTMSSVLTEDLEGGEKPVYFISKVFKGAELRYQRIERLALAIITTAIKLRPYFQSHRIILKTNYPSMTCSMCQGAALNLKSWLTLSWNSRHQPRTSLPSCGSYQ